LPNLKYSSGIGRKFVRRMDGISSEHNIHFSIDMEIINIHVYTGSFVFKIM
jgi:hypothetical protein